MAQEENKGILATRDVTGKSRDKEKKYNVSFENAKSIYYYDVNDGDYWPGMVRGWRRVVRRARKPNYKHPALRSMPGFLPEEYRMRRAIAKNLAETLGFKDDGILGQHLGETGDLCKVLNKGGTAMPSPSTWIVDSGTCQHLLQKSDKPRKQKAHELDQPMPLRTANGPVDVYDATDTQIKPLGHKLETALLDKTPNALSMGRMCVLDGYDFHWPPYAPRPVLTHPDGRVFNLPADNFVPLLDDNITGVNIAAPSSEGGSSCSKDGGGAVEVPEVAVHEQGGFASGAGGGRLEVCL